MKKGIIQPGSLSYGSYWSKVGTLSTSIYINSSAVAHVIYGGINANPVVPGQPIPILWYFFILGLPQDTVIASVYLDTGNALLYQSPQTVVLNMNAFQNIDYKPATILAPPFGGIANALYKIGMTTLRLDIAPVAITKVFSFETDIQIVPEAVESSWWQWTQITTSADSSETLPPMQLLGPKTYSSLINHAFTLEGKMVNKGISPNNTMSGTAVLVETDYQNKQSVDLESRTFTIGPNGSQEIVFSRITKNWSWLIPGIWVYNFSEPRSKRFDYTVRFAMSDSYGNFYSDAISLATYIEVSVGSSKKAYADGAIAAVAVGLIASIFTFGAAAAVGQALAAGLGVKALDPPFPDPNYTYLAHIPLEKPGSTIKDERFGELEWLLKLGGKTVELIEALDSTYNRYLGAKEAKDKKYSEHQQNTYYDILEYLKAIVEDIPVAAQLTLEHVMKNEELSNDSLTKKVLTLNKSGLSQQSYDHLTNEHCTHSGINQLLSAAGDENVMALASNINQAINVLTWSLIYVTSQIANQADGLFKKKGK